MPKYSKIEVKLIDEDANAFSIVTLTRRALRKGGVSKEEIDKYVAKAFSGDYQNLLAVTNEWVTVT